MNAPDSIRRHKLSIDDFHRMGEAGILSEDSRVELIAGELIDMAPIGSVHASTVDLLTELFVRQLSGEFLVRAQNPILLPPDSEPQPDLTLVRARADRYRDGLPGAADVLLLVEVADTSLATDRRLKIPLYARHGIAEVWLVDLHGSAVEVHRSPSAGRYSEVLHPGRHDAIAPAALPDVVIPLGRLWGEAQDVTTTQQG